jgi:hypothetical protein
MKKIIALIMLLLLFSSSAGSFSVSISKKTYLDSDDKICIGRINVKGFNVSCKGEVFTVKKVPEKFDLYVEYFLEAPKTGLFDFDVAIAAVVPLPDQDNKKMVQTFDKKDGNISFHIEMNNQMLAYKKYVLVGIYGYVDLSDPFNPDYNFTFDFAFISVICLVNRISIVVEHKGSNFYHLPIRRLFV